MFSTLSLLAQEYHLEIGEQFLEKGESEKSISFFEIAKDSFLIKNNDTAVALCYNLIAKAFLNQGQFEHALEQNEKGLKYARRSNFSTAYLRLLLFKTVFYNVKEKPEIGRACWREIKEKLEVKNDVAASAYRAFANAYMQEPNDTFELIATRGLEIALQFKDSTQISNAYRILADRAILLAEIPKAITNLLVGIKHIPANKKVPTANFALLLSDCFESLGDYSKALIYAEQAINQLKNTRYLSFQHSVYNQLAGLYASIGDSPIAENYWNKCLDYYQEKEEWNKILNVYNRKLSHYLSLKEDPKIDINYNKIQTIDFSNVDEQTLNFTNRTLTKYYFHKGNLVKAKEVLEKWKATKDLVARPENQIEYLHYKSLISESSGQYNKSIELLHKANSKIDDIKSKKQSDLVYLLESEYHQAEKETEINLLEHQNEVIQFKVNLRKVFLFLSSIFLCIAALLTFLFYKRNKTIRLQKEKIRKALIEKNILLEEIHSRVKNSLQTISSILKLQSRTMKDGVAAEAIKEGQNRVNSMAIIHENLFLENNTSQINIKTYIDHLLEELFKSYNVESNKIRLEKKVMSGIINVDKIIPIGLILNELVSNALKHAFKGKEKGILRVEFLKSKNEFQLAVIDNGIGISTNNSSGEQGFGTRIIKAFAKKLNANVSRTSGAGTSVVVSFSSLK